MEKLLIQNEATSFYGAFGYIFSVCHKNCPILPYSVCPISCPLGMWNSPCGHGKVAWGSHTMEAPKAMSKLATSAPAEPSIKCAWQIIRWDRLKKRFPIENPGDLGKIADLGFRVFFV